jgi:hypothetical protein
MTYEMSGQRSERLNLLLEFCVCFIFQGFLFVVVVVMSKPRKSRWDKAVPDATPSTDAAVNSSAPSASSAVSNDDPRQKVLKNDTLFRRFLIFLFFF